MRPPRHVLTATLLLAASCQAGASRPSQDQGIERSSQAIIGGVEARSDKAVVAVFVGGLCTGTLVAPRIVLTAAHCVGDAIVAGATNFGRVSFGDGRGPWIKSINIVDMAMHRLYSPPAFLSHDIALVRLASPAPESIAPIPISTTSLSKDDIGLPLRVVGFGNTDGKAGTGAGAKRQLRIPLAEVSPTHIGFGDHFYNTCQGDSGGPTFANFGGPVEYVIGVTSFGSNECRGTSQMTRTDIMWDPFLTEVISAWSGPCQNDGVCVQDASCAFPDPDCDPCGMDGVCADNCPQPDRDCPLGGLASAACSNDLQCESRLCASAPEDSRIQYCSTSCDPSKTGSASGCPLPIRICEKQPDGSGICGFPGITPGAQGANCKTGGDCRSGLCEANDGICVERCGADLPACETGFECLSLGSTSVCALPPTSGGCSTAGSTRTSALPTLLIFLFLAYQRKRGRTLTVQRS